MKRRTLLSAAPAAATIATIRPGAARAAAPATVTLWHAMGGQLGQTLQGIVDGFNKSQTAVKVEAAYKGTYAEVLTATVAAWRAGKAPSIAQIFDVGTAEMLSAGPAALPVYALAAKSHVAIDATRYIPAVRGYYGVTGDKMGGAPFNASTSLMWINEDAFKRAGLDPAAPLDTWDDVAKAARTIKAKGAAEIPMMTSWCIWTQFEQFGAIHDVPFASLGNGFGGPKPKLMFDSAAYQHHLGNLLAWQKEGLFKYEGRDGGPSPIFYSGKAAISFDSSAIFGQLKQSAKFAFRDALLPHYPAITKAPKNSIIGGAAFWTMTAPHRTEAEYRGVAEFLNYLTHPAVDAHWAKATGYVPVTLAGSAYLEKTGYYKANPGSDLAVRQLTRTKPTPYSRGVRLGGMAEVFVIIEEEWERAIGDGTPAKTALANAAKRGQAVIDRFARTAHG